ncbi:pyridoxal phosphate-dependent decarboxylase family protein [Portibacter lacus]|uniref:L-2,4-diaminobutyrate decarboxylase n=1 Tax=Portibacter lacus TaxID=1099794 RepID=A0AA37WFQ2_9BACT|nr:aminotransferase class I/II-fold pyridoxal phosphate-dependent enzyme [Portibacter lacus]GLR17939.1 L-2,4-diaminobutyrate decarboxylase [Portibacter lacus]
MSKLLDLYNPDQFESIGKELITFLSDYLRKATADKIPVNNYKDPELALSSWKEFMKKDASLIDYFKKVIEDSIHLHNPNYMGHQVSAPAPLAAFGGLISDLLNNGMAVYEMGGASNPLEKMATDLICQAAGYDENSAGFMTSGGTLANLTALITARSVKTNVWDEGNSNQKLGIMVSEQAHYSVDRAARIMGLGSEGIIKLPVGDDYSVLAQKLTEKLEEAEANGIHVFAIVSSSCSTSTGSYDEIEAFKEFAQMNNIWLHVDGAHGGSAIFSKKYKHLLKGVEKADSFIVDCHKMMMTPTLCTAVLYKNRAHTLATFRQKAEYLFDESEQYDWHNSGKRTFECTKLMMSIKMMAIVRHSGAEVFEELVDTLYDNAAKFAQIIDDDPMFELALQPQANIICFRLITDSPDEVNSRIRQKILEEGKFYIVQTILNGHVYLRTSIMNPLTTEHHFHNLLKEIKRISYIQIQQTM